MCVNPEQHLKHAQLTSGPSTATKQCWSVSASANAASGSGHPESQLTLLRTTALSWMVPSELMEQLHSDSNDPSGQGFQGKLHGWCCNRFRQGRSSLGCVDFLTEESLNVVTTPCGHVAAHGIPELLSRCNSRATHGAKTTVRCHSLTNVRV